MNSPKFIDISSLVSDGRDRKTQFFKTYLNIYSIKTTKDFKIIFWFCINLHTEDIQIVFSISV